MIQKQLAEGFEALGIRSGDTLLVHSSLKSLEGASPADVIEALLALLGPEPAAPSAGGRLDRERHPCAGDGAEGLERRNL